MRTLKHWCHLLIQLHPDHLPVHQHYTLSSLPPGSPQLGSADSEWQQLSVAKLDTAPTKLPVTVPTHALSRPQQAKPASSDSSVHTHSHERGQAGVEEDFWANQILYVGQEPGQQQHDVLTFRELFLHSYALENIIVGRPAAVTSQLYWAPRKMYYSAHSKCIAHSAGTLLALCASQISYLVLGATREAQNLGSMLEDVIGNMHAPVVTP